jgi:hypothetical protein
MRYYGMVNISYDVNGHMSRNTKSQNILENQNYIMETLNTERQSYTLR